MKATKRQKRVALLLSRGYCKARTLSTKYFAFDNPARDNKLWLGKSAIREGRTAGDSRPIFYRQAQRTVLDERADELWEQLATDQQAALLDQFPELQRRRVAPATGW